MPSKKNKYNLWTSANIVTMIRIFFVPLFVAVFLSPWPSWIDNSGNLEFLKPWLALIIFVVLSITDSIDGHLARSKNQITNFGKFMDPLADKILVFAALISLVDLKVLPSWVVLIILIREFIISGIRMLAASKGMVIAASWYGKAKTVTQLIAIILFILKESLLSSGIYYFVNPLHIIAWTVMIIALILTIVSMIDYIYNARTVFLDEDSSPDVQERSKKLVSIASEKKIKIGTAESLTGGLIASKITSVSGASLVFSGSIVSYMYVVKEKLLNVSSKLLKDKGAVNQETAKTMSNSALKSLSCDYSVSTTGIAGPNKDEFNTEIGTVFISCSNKENCIVKEFHFKGNREEIRNKSVEEAINLLITFIQENYK